MPTAEKIEEGWKSLLESYCAHKEEKKNTSLLSGSGRYTYIARKAAHRTQHIVPNATCPQYTTLDTFAGCLVTDDVPYWW